MQIIGGKLTIELDAPVSGILQPVEEFYPTITITPDNTKIFLDVNYFCTSDKAYVLILYKDDTEWVDLWYADRDVTINGEETFISDTYTFTNLTLKKGWNYVLRTEAGNNKTFTTASQTQPSGFSWTVWKP